MARLTRCADDKMLHRGNDQSDDRQGNRDQKFAPECRPVCQPNERQSDKNYDNQPGNPLTHRKGGQHEWARQEQTEQYRRPHTQLLDDRSVTPRGPGFAAEWQRTFRATRG